MTQIGPYTIVEKLGAGGMGEVYRARDSRLGRDVAIKVLPPALANDAAYLARFQREAQVLASLNHPNIAAIYGLEDNAIVMELVEGSELKGPLPLDEVIRIAKQIADALEAAHERGIIHRDLKPANIRTTPDGTVKILDFGLAKATEPAVTTSASAANSPTLTIHATTAGMILGTAAYMPPEQAAGKPVDRRADIWAFGIVLWELITGRRLFEGETISHILAHVLTGPINLTPIPEGPMRTLIARCLERDTRKRLAWIGEARAILDAPATAPPQRASLLPWIMAALFAFIVAGVALWPRTAQTQPEPGKLRRYSIGHPGFEPVLFDQPVAAISPDGDRIAYIAGPKLWIRRLDDEEARAVEGLVEPSFPFWSPDGRFVACWAGGQIWRVNADGSSPTALGEASYLRGATWSSDGRSIVTTGGLSVSVFPVEGGPRKNITSALGVRNFRSLSAIPGHQKIFAQTQYPSKIATVDLDTGKLTSLDLPGTWATFADGWLLVSRSSRNWGSDIWAVRFDPASDKLLGKPVLLLRGATLPTVGRDGTLLYVDGAFTQPVRRDRSGRRMEALGLPVAGLHAFSVSRDGRKVAISSDEDGNSDIWIIQNGRRTRLTNDAETDLYMTWSHDGDALTWVKQPRQIMIQSSADAAPRLLFQPGDTIVTPQEWSPDGKMLMVTEYDSSAGTAAYIRQAQGGKWELARLAASPGRYPSLSPDGRYFAHHRFVGEPHIFVRPFPAGGQSWQISTAPSRQQHWSSDGKELYFLSGNHVMATSIRTSPAFQAGTPQPLFEISNSQGLVTNSPHFEVLADDTFVLLELVPVKQGSTLGLHVVENWKRLLEEK